MAKNTSMTLGEHFEDSENKVATLLCAATFQVSMIAVWTWGDM